MSDLDVKRRLVAVLRASLEEEVARTTRAAKDAAEGATHEDNKPEGDKDMRSTEASYIARGQAQRVSEIAEGLARLDGMPVKAFAPGARIEASALVDLEHEGKETTYFLVPVAGGRTIEAAGVRAQTLAVTSPLGRALLGLSEGDDAEVQTPRGAQEHAIVRVR
jgi:transcription elongation GreA/GreB family factor